MEHFPALKSEFVSVGQHDINMIKLSVCIDGFDHKFRACIIKDKDKDNWL